MRTQFLFFFFLFLQPYFINAQEDNSIIISESLIVQLEKIPEEQRIFHLSLNDLNAVYGATYLERYFELMSDFKIRFQFNPTDAQVLVVLGEYWFEESTELTAINQYLSTRSNRVKSFLDEKVKPGDNISSLVNLETQTNNDATALVTQLVGTGINFSNAELDCPTSAVGTFDGTGTNLKLSSGIILTSGDINLAAGPNNLSNATANNEAPGDPLLGALINGAENVDTSVNFVYDQILKYDIAAVINIDTNASSSSNQLIFTLSDSSTFTVETINDFGFIEGPNVLYLAGNFSELIFSDTTIIPLDIYCTPEDCDTFGVYANETIFYDSTAVLNIDTLSADEFFLNYEVTLLDSTIINYSEDLSSNFATVLLTLPNWEFPLYGDSASVTASDITTFPLDITCIPENCDTNGIVNGYPLVLDTASLQSIIIDTTFNGYGYTIVLLDSTTITYSDDTTINTVITLPDDQTFYGPVSMVMEGDETILPLEETYTASGQTLCDACILEFDFVSDSTQLYFNFVFASEEYMEYFCDQFNDVFGFFISGPNPEGGEYVNENIAFVSGTDIPVAINNVGNGVCDSINNSTRYVDNSGGTTVQYDGFTTVFTVNANLVSGADYHFKIGIMDVGDCILDSGVFLEQGTFSSSSSAPESNLPNDICEGAIPLTIGQTCADTFDNTLAVDEGIIAPAACYDRFTTVNDVWYSFVAPENGVVCIQTDCCEGTLDTFQVAVYSGDNCSSLLEVACKMSYEDCDYIYVTPGETHYIRVNGIAEEGTFCLQINEPDCSTLPTPNIQIGHVQLYSSSYWPDVEVTNAEEFPDDVYTYESPLSSNCSTRLEAEILNAVDSSVLNAACIYSIYNLSTLSFSVQQDSCPPSTILLRIIDNLCGDVYYSEPLAISCNHDGDAAFIYDDCDDFNDAVFPGGTEICDNLDNNCDGYIDEGFETMTLSCYPDNDGDGHFRMWASNYTVCPDQTCPDIGMSATIGDDCDDNDENISPSATEACDEIDNNCNGITDEGFVLKVLVCYQDNDEDGYYSSNGNTYRLCDTTLNCIDVLVNSVDTAGTDCNDFNSAVFPGAGCCIIEDIDITLTPCDTNNLFDATFVIHHSSVSSSAFLQIYAESGIDLFTSKNVDSDTITTVTISNIAANGQEYPLNISINDGFLFCNVIQTFQVPLPCVAPPSNDSCVNAILIPDISTCQTIVASTKGASSANHYTCPSGGDVWYQFTALSSEIQITTGANALLFEVLADSCINFNESISPCVFLFENSHLYLNGFTPGEDYKIRVWFDSGITEGEFCISNPNCSPLPTPILEVSDVNLFSSSYSINLTVTNTHDYPSSIYGNLFGNLPNDCYYRMKAEIINVLDSSILVSNCLYDSTALLNFSFSVEQDSCPPESVVLRITDYVCDTIYYSAPLAISCDADMDMVAIYEDCNDFDATIYPGAVEICDGLDNNCDGMIDEGLDLVEITCYPDNDGDGYFRNYSVSQFVCPDQTCPDIGMSATEGNDCNDFDENINPDATEICDGNDNNCNGFYDEGTLFKVLVCYQDHDGDGYYSSFGNTYNVCDTTQTCLDVLVNSVDTAGTDCNDFNIEIFPGAGCCTIKEVNVTLNSCDTNNLFSGIVEIYHSALSANAFLDVSVNSENQSGGSYYFYKAPDSDTMTTIILQNIVADGQTYTLNTFIQDGTLACNDVQNIQTPTPCVTPPANDSCQHATILSDINSCQTIVASTAGALSQVINGCSSASDIWYQFTAESVGVKVTATDLESYGTNNMIFEIYADSCVEFSSSIDYCRYLHNNASASVSGLIPGENYKLRVWFEGGVKGEFCLEATCGIEITEALTTTACNTTNNTFDLTLEAILLDGIIGDSLVISAGNIRQKFPITAINDTMSYTVTGINATGAYTNVSLNTEGVRACELFLYGLFSAPPPCVAPPVNDTCQHAIIIDDLINCMPISVSTVGATEDNNNFGCSNLGGDIWYQFTAPSENINLTAIDIVAQGQSSLIYELYDTCVGASPINYCHYICNGCENTISGLTIGQDYYLRIALSEAVTASFCIQGAVNLNNDDVCHALPVNLDEFYSGSFTNATTQANEPYALGGDCLYNWCDTVLYGSVWYQFVAPIDSAVQIETYAHDHTKTADTKIALYGGVDCELSNPFQNAVLLDANDDKPGDCCDGSIISLACLNPGETYYVQIEQFGPNQPDFDVIVRPLENCNLSCDLVSEGVGVSVDSCNGNGGGIFPSVISPSGQIYEIAVSDTLGNLLFTTNHDYLFGMTAGFYHISARSLEVADCEIDFGIIEVPAAAEVECPVAIAGNDQLDICGASTTLGAMGNGFWSVNNSDEAEEFSDVHDPTATFSGTFGYAYELVWTVVTPCCEDDSDTVTIQFNGDDDNNGIQNCAESGDCPPTLAVDDMIIHPGTYQAGVSITSTGGVAANDNVIFKAGQSITLLPGFSANGTFHAFIDDCSIATIQEPEAVAPTAKYIDKEVEVLRQPLTLTIQPNPFYQETKIVYELKESKKVDLRVFDMNGKLVTTVVSSQLQEKGTYQYDFKPAESGATVYFAILVTEDAVISKKMIFIR